MSRPEFGTCVEDQGERFTTKLKRSLGMAAVKLTAVAGAATAIFGVGSSIEASTGHEARAEASPYSANGAEKAWCRWPSRFALCNKAGELAGKALVAAEEVAADTGWGLAKGGADAVRHCYWNALMTDEFGRATASGFGWRHEYTEQFGTEESDMDLHNNLKGRDWATDPNPLQRCIDGVNGGELIRLEN